MNIKFCGAASGVTGSCHLLTFGEHKILLDCGQFQGGKTIEKENYEPFPFDPKEIECVLLSHAHIDHCGRLPLLVKEGFTGSIYCTATTAELLDIMLKDSGYIHEKEAEWKNKKELRAGKSLTKPLYTYDDAVATLKYVKPVLYDQLIEIDDDFKFVFNDAGHILGSAITEIWATEDDKTSKIVFSGDLGVKGRPILRDPTVIKKADVLIMETTYGNRLHNRANTSISDLFDIVVKTIMRGGTVVIPSFAVGRTQELIYEFNKLFDEEPEFQNKLAGIKVYIDSPMAVNATEVFKNNPQIFDEQAREFIRHGDNVFEFAGLTFTRTTEESQKLNADNSPKVIISASGMCEAGRIRHHLKHNLWNSKSSIVFVGYQAEGTLGRMIVDGVKDVVLFGDSVHVAAEIYNLEGFSGHADQDGLLTWVSGFQQIPKEVFLVHGESESKEDFAKLLKEKLGIDSIVVQGISEFKLETGEILSKEEQMAKIFDSETLENMKKKLVDIRMNIGNILANTDDAIANQEDFEKLTDLNNKIVELEKSAIALENIVTTK